METLVGILGWIIGIVVAIGSIMIEIVKEILEFLGIYVDTLVIRLKCITEASIKSAVKKDPKLQGKNAQSVLVTGVIDDLEKKGDNVTLKLDVLTKTGEVVGHVTIQGQNVSGVKEGDHISL